MKRLFDAVFAVLLCTMFFSCADKAVNKEVHFYGKMVNFNNEVIMTAQDPVSQLLDKGISIVSDENGNFDVRFSIDTPQYFRMGRNTLYFKPGDEVKAFVDYKDPIAATFEGSSVQENNYLKYKPFPKAGAFLDAGSLIKGVRSKEEAAEKIYAEYQRYEDSLKALTAVSDEFRFFEQIRNKASLVCAYSSFYSYYSFVGPKECRDLFKEDVFNAEIKDVLKGIVPEGRLVCIDEFSSVMGYYFDSSWGLAQPDRELKEYNMVNTLSDKLSYTGYNAELQKEKDSVAAVLTLPDYSNALNLLFESYEKLMPGKPAPEITMYDTEGKPVALSGFKGKVTVIDVWATWCGPCKSLSPAYHKLADELGDKVNFISLSIDDDIEAWKADIVSEKSKSRELRINRPDMKEYNLVSVPRFMVLDAEGNFIDSKAPTPDTDALKNLILENIR